VRLTPKGYAAGLVSEEKYRAFLKKQEIGDMSFLLNLNW
jgi:tRNA U34 5-carboxymethylaminomethyl modifying enzyme MnmG/GidA